MRRPFCILEVVIRKIVRLLSFFSIPTGFGTKGVIRYVN